MAEIEQEKTVIVDVVENVETTEVVSWNTIPPNRPRKVYAGMWGPSEIGVVSVSLLTLLMTLVAYFFWVVPSSRELARNRSEADRLEAELISARTKYGEITDTETQVARIVDRISEFETQFLPIRTTGQAALYQRMNSLIAAYGLTNTTGPDYAPLEGVNMDQPGEQTSEEKGRSKFRSLYPGVYVSTTVEGSYQNLRRFIREIEAGREFIVVSAIELPPSDTVKRKEQPNLNAETTANPVNPGFGMDSRGMPVRPGAGPVPVQPQPQVQAKQQGKTHGETVSLHIELVAYFRRPTVASAVIQ